MYHSTNLNRVCILFSGLRNPIDVELFTPKVDGEEIDDDLSTTDQISSTIPTEESQTS